MTILNMVSNLLLHSLAELTGVILLHGYVIVHDIVHYLRMEGMWVAHPVLEAKVLVVSLGEQVILVHGCPGCSAVGLAVDGNVGVLRLLAQSPSGADGGLRWVRCGVQHLLSR